jgi:hypothetical protein
MTLFLQGLKIYLTIILITFDKIIRFTHEHNLKLKYDTPNQT